MENNLHSSSAGQGMGIASLVLGILAVVAAFIPCFALVAILFGILAIVFGAIGLSQAKNENAPTTMPKSGLILGIVATGFVIVWLLVYVGTLGTILTSVKDKIEEGIDSTQVETTRTHDSLNNDLEKMKDSVTNGKSEN
ncbi:MAG TPA: DUF4190 domain-containing protein [Flavobacterium sp.]|jgi:hypothetical protein